MPTWVLASDEVHVRPDWPHWGRKTVHRHVAPDASALEAHVVLSPRVLSQRPVRPSIWDHGDLSGAILVRPFGTGDRTDHAWKRKAASPVQGTHVDAHT